MAGDRDPRGPRQPRSRCWEAAPRGAPHLSVPLHFRNEGFLVEKGLQPLVHVVVAELFKSCRPLAPPVPGVVEARSVHHGDGGHGEVLGGERPGERATHTAGFYPDVSQLCPQRRPCRLPPEAHSPGWAPSHAAGASPTLPASPSPSISSQGEPPPPGTVPLLPPYASPTSSLICSSQHLPPAWMETCGVGCSQPALMST